MNRDNEIGGLQRGQRTARKRCGIQLAVCRSCAVSLKADADLLRCPQCDRKWVRAALDPCPRPATRTVTEEDGTEDLMCPSHARYFERINDALDARNAKWAAMDTQPANVAPERANAALTMPITGDKR